MAQGGTGGSFVTQQRLKKSAFGELLTADLTAYIQATGVYGFIPPNFRSYTQLGGTTGVVDRMFTVTSGTTAYAYGAIQSLRSLNYNPGQAGLARFTALFQNSAENHWSGVGLVTITDELSFGYEGTVFGIWYRREGAAEVRTITVTVPSSGATNLTLTLDSVAYTIPLTAGTASQNTYEIANWLNANQTAWVADQIDGTLIISSQSDGPKSGTYSYSHATSTGTIVQNKAGVTKTSTHIPQSGWNRDVCEWLDPSKGNVYEIIYPYLGFGSVEFYVKSPNTFDFELVHVLEYENQNTRPSLSNPSLHFGMYSASIGSTTNVTVQCASTALFVLGTVKKTRNPRTIGGTQTVSTTFTNVVSVRNRRTYNSVYNQVEIEPIHLTVASESGKTVQIEVRTNPTFSGSTNFLNVGNNLVSDYDVSSNTVSGGTLLASFTISPGQTLSVDLVPFEIRVPPSLTISVSARVVSGPPSSVTASITYYEDL